jgi:ABC-2 type transport system ATP-binding protein
MQAAAIETRGLSKRYGRHGVLALDELDLRVGSGEVFGFLGPNGAGKTTTIRLLLDLLRPTSGSAHVLDLDTSTGGLEIRRRVGYLPGELPFAARETAATLLTFLGNLRGGVPANRIHTLAERFNLDLTRSVRALSKGNKQKVALVQAFMHDPELLILDEPSSGLDPLLQQEFLALIREVRNAGHTVFMSSHILAEVDEIADRIAVLRQGRLVTIESVAGLRERAGHSTEIWFAQPVPADAFGGLEGVRDVVVDGNTLRCVVEESADAGFLDAELPEYLSALMGTMDYASAEGYLNSTFFTLIGSLLMVIFSLTIGARAVAGDEESGMLDVLLAHPVSRTRCRPRADRRPGDGDRPVRLRGLGRRFLSLPNRRDGHPAGQHRRCVYRIGAPGHGHRLSGTGRGRVYGPGEPGARRRYRCGAGGLPGQQPGANVRGARRGPEAFALLLLSRR